MRKIKLAELSGMENLAVSSLFAMKQHWYEGQAFAMRSPRRQSAFLWFVRPLQNQCASKSATHHRKKHLLAQVLFSMKRTCGA